MTRTYRELVAALDADAFDVHQPDVVLAAGMLRGRELAELALAKRRWYTPHTWTNGIGLLANLHVAAGVGGGPFIEFPYDPPGWTPERRDFMLAEPVRVGPDGILRVPQRPGLGRGSRRGRAAAVRGMTDLKSLGLDDWLARASALQPAKRGIHRRAVRARRRRGGRSPTSARATGSRSPRSRRATRRTSTGPSPRPERSFEDRRWADQSPKNRKRVLLRFAELIRADRERLALIESLDVGKPIRDTLAVDVPSCATTFQWYAEAIDKVYGEIGPTGPEALSLVTREPVGVVAAIVPWNYPLIITAWKVGPALAAGNSVVLKPASQSPLSALRLAELAAEAGLPDGVLNVVPGPGATVGDALARHPGVDKVVVHRLDRRSASRCCGRSARPTSRASRSSSAARARSSSSPTSATSRRRPRRSAGGSSTTAARPATRVAARRPPVGPRGARRADRGAGAAARAGRAARPEDAARGDRRRDPARQGARLRRARAARRARGSSPAASGPSRRPAATTSRRRSSTASTTRCGSPARRSSARS